MSNNRHFLGFNLEIRRKAALEDIAARERGNPDRNPDMTPKTPAGGKSYSQMTREERSKLTPQEIDRLVVQELGG